MLGALASGIDDGSAAGIALLLLLLLPLLSLPRPPPPPPTCATYLTHTLLHTVGEPHSPCPSFFPPPRRRPSRLLLLPLPVYAPTPLLDGSYSPLLTRTLPVFEQPFF